MDLPYKSEVIKRIYRGGGRVKMNSEYENENWKEVMKLAEKYGFIVQAFGGVAVLATKEMQRKKVARESD